MDAKNAFVRVMGIDIYAIQIDNAFYTLIR